MSARVPVCDIRLNAYVDGELPPDEAAILADLVARDAGLARRVAALADLKAGVAGLAAPEAPDIPHASGAGCRRIAGARASGGRAGMLAAGLAVAALLGWVFVPPPQTGGEPSALEPAGAVAVPAAVVALHDAWVADRAAGATPAQEPRAPAWMRSLLEANGLQLRHGAPVMLAPDVPGLHYAFVGPNACKLSLIESAARDGASAMVLNADGGLQTATWESGAHGYVMVARNMNRARFATIAAAVHAATETRALAEGELLAAMAGARQRCNA